MDFKLNNNGELELKDGEITSVDGKDYLIQCAISRLKSIRIDWFKDNIGADMEELIGLPNIKETGEKGKNKIMTAMIEDNLFTEAEVVITLYPANRNSIAYNVAFDKAPYGKFQLNAALDLVKGINVWEV